MAALACPGFPVVRARVLSLMDEDLVQVAHVAFGDPRAGGFSLAALD